jgi:hypothetical protein
MNQWRKKMAQQLMSEKEKIELQKKILTDK